MTEPASSIGPSDDSILNRLRHELLNQTAREEKHLRVTIYVKVILLAFVTIYLGWAYVSLKTMDAELLVLGAKEKILEMLPEAKQKMKDRLTQMAPSIVDQVGTGLIDGLPKLTKDAQESAQKTLITLADPLEKDMAVWLADFVKETKALTNDMFPGLSSYEQITCMRTYVMDDLTDSIKTVSYNIGDNLQDHGLTLQLRRLLRGRNLTEKEKLNREILAIWYLIVEHKVANLNLEALEVNWPALD